MSFQEAVTTALTKLLDWQGRARRSEYWYFSLFVGLVNAACSIIATILPLLDPVRWLISVVLTLPTITVSIRRLHDIGKPGWYVLVQFIPVVGQIIMLIWCITDSEPCANAYGECPKQFL